MKEKGIILHKKYGVNPTVSVCLYCGKDTGVALLGASYKKEAPMRMVVTNEPCDECKEKIDEGWVAFFSDCGHNGLVKREALLGILEDSEVERINKAHIVRFEKCPSCLGIVE